VRSKKISAPCGHHDQRGNSQFGQFSVVAKQGSRPGAEASERQCHRAHELDRFNGCGNPAMVMQTQNEPALLRVALKECIDMPMTFQSQEKTPRATSTGYHTRLHQSRASRHFRLANLPRLNYRPPAGAPASKVSGGSKKQRCQSAESDRVPARHSCSVGTVAAIMPPSTESKIKTIPARFCGF
jgi:hypothetical protein